MGTRIGDDEMENIARKVSDKIAQNIECQMFVALDVHAKKLTDVAKETITTSMKSFEKEVITMVDTLVNRIEVVENDVAAIKREIKTIKQTYPLIKAWEFTKKNAAGILIVIGVTALMLFL
jgi:esterase/lipase